MKVRKANRGDAIYVCTPNAGNCCCGHTGKGNRKIKWRRVLEAWLAHAVSQHIPLVATKCLGPCKKANVILFRCNGRSFWFRKMKRKHLADLFDYALEIATETRTVAHPKIETRLFTP